MRQRRPAADERQVPAGSRSGELAVKDGQLARFQRQRARTGQAVAVKYDRVIGAGHIKVLAQRDDAVGLRLAAAQVEQDISLDGQPIHRAGLHRPGVNRGLRRLFIVVRLVVGFGAGDGGGVADDGRRQRGDVDRHVSLLSVRQRSDVALDERRFGAAARRARPHRAPRRVQVKSVG